MNHYLNLVGIFQKVHKKQSRMVRGCIILAVFLVTSIFSMVEVWTEGQLETMRNKHGDWHIALHNMDEGNMQKIVSTLDVDSSVWFDEINEEELQGYTIHDTNVILYGTEEAFIKKIMNYDTEGNFPQTDHEVALSIYAKECFDVELGDTIYLSTPNGEILYTVSGFCYDDIAYLKNIGGNNVYMTKEAFCHVQKQNDLEGSPRYFIRFSSERRLGKTIEKMKKDNQLTDQNIDENIAVLSLLGASSNLSVNNLYLTAMVCFMIIMIAGVFMISSCMNSNVAQRTKFFGMMRCIGASKKQIIRYVRLEALHWCKTAIPIGCGLGTVACWILSTLLKYMVKGEFADIPLFSVSIVGIVCGCIVGVISVFIAAQSPAKQAAKVSPSAAVSGNADIKETHFCKANTSLFQIETALGVHHATKKKKNLFLMTGSFALTIMLILTFSGCLDIVKKLLPSESDYTPDIAFQSQDEMNSIDRKLVDEIREMEGVESASGIMYQIEYPALINGKELTIDLYSYSEEMFQNAKKSIISGDLSNIYRNSNGVMAIWSENTHMDVLDKLTIAGEEMIVECVVSEGIGGMSDSPVVVCSEETFIRLIKETGYGIVSIDLDKKVSETVVDDIYRLAGDVEIVDNRNSKSEMYGSYWVFRFAAYGFLTIISLITILNIMNSVSMGVSSRVKQYGVMRAVGMENRQVIKMITSEAASFAMSGMLVGSLLGLFMHHFIYKKIVMTHFGGEWNVPYGTIFVIIVLVVFSCVVSIYEPAKRISNMSIIETMNDM